MDRDKKVLDEYAVAWQTNLSASRVRETVKRAETYQKDEQKKKRLEMCFCVPCFYTSGMAGQAFTSRPCGGCETEICSSNTTVDVLCPACAKFAELCRRCGGDLHMRERRRKPVRFPSVQP